MANEPIREICARYKYFSIEQQKIKNKKCENVWNALYSLLIGCWKMGCVPRGSDLFAIIYSYSQNAAFDHLPLPFIESHESRKILICLFSHIQS